LKSHGIATGK